MARENPKKGLAFILYMETDLSQKEIADQLDTTEATVSKWANADNWKQKKAVDALSPDKLVREFYNQAFDIMEKAKKDNRPVNSSEADSLVKLAAAIDKLDRKVSPSIVTAAFMRFNNWVRVQDLELVKKMMPYQMRYLQELIKPEGSK
jgi:predicted transcriptional regulator